MKTKQITITYLTIENRYDLGKVTKNCFSNTSQIQLGFNNESVRDFIADKIKEVLAQYGVNDYKIYMNGCNQFTTIKTSTVGDLICKEVFNKADIDFPIDISFSETTQFSYITGRFEIVK